MTDLVVRWKKLHPHASLPTYGTEGASAVDLRHIEEKHMIRPGETYIVKTGLACEIPQGWGGFILPRSGLGVKHGLVVGNLVGLIDSDYRGEVMVCLWNRHPTQEYTIEPGERIAQMVFLQTPKLQMVMAEELSDTARGEGGWGSTGKV